MTTLYLHKALPFEVAYLREGEQTYVKLSKKDFEKILMERHGYYTLMKLWMGIAVVVAVTLAGTAYWLTAHPVTEVVMVAPADIK